MAVKGHDRFLDPQPDQRRVGMGVPQPVRADHDDVRRTRVPHDLVRDPTDGAVGIPGSKSRRDDRHVANRSGDVGRSLLGVRVGR